jgi:hypothetical protein
LLRGLYAPRASAGAGYRREGIQRPAQLPRLGETISVGNHLIPGQETVPRTSRDSKRSDSVRPWVQTDTHGTRHRRQGAPGRDNWRSVDAPCDASGHQFAAAAGARFEIARAAADQVEPESLQGFRDEWAHILRCEVQEDRANRCFGDRPLASHGQGWLRQPRPSESWRSTLANQQEDTGLSWQGEEMRVQRNSRPCSTSSRPGCMQFAHLGKPWIFPLDPGSRMPEFATQTLMAHSIALTHPDTRCHSSVTRMDKFE